MRSKDGALRIAISGKSGCGNTTVSKILASQLGLRFINFTFRTLASEQGISLEEVLARAAVDEWWDREVDTRQVELARADGGCVLGSRLAVWMLPEADLKVYLRARPETRASRIASRESDDLAAVAAFTQMRDEQDQKRYLALYNIDTDDLSPMDLIIDVDDICPETIVERIQESLRQRALLP